MLLVLNDHLLKGASLPGWLGGAHVPAWLTGKLSDFVGPVVAAALLAVVLAVRTRRGWLLAHLATATGFAAINLSPWLARWIEAWTASTPMPWIITVDPSDVIGLIALPLSYVILGHASARQARATKLWRPLARGIAIPVSALACMATSAPAEPLEPSPPSFPDAFGAVALGNATDQDRLIRVRPLRESVVVDCPTMLADPSHTLPRELFASATTWSLEAGRALPLANSSRMCTAYLVESEGMPSMILAWYRFNFEDTWIPSTTALPNRSLALLQEVNGDWLSLVHETASFLRPAEPTSGQCLVADAGSGLDWSDSAIGLREITDIKSAPNDCYEFSFASGSDQVICVPIEPPFAIGEQVQVTQAALVGADLREADTLEVRSATTSMLIARGNLLPPGTSRVEALEGCPVQHDECNSSVRQARLLLEDSGEVFATAGQSVELPSGEELHLVRVQQMPAHDLECAPAATSLDYLEYLLIQDITEAP